MNYQNKFVWNRLQNFVVDRRNQVVFFGIVLAIILFLTVSDFIKAVVFILLLQTANYFSAWFLRPIKRFRIGIELILLSTVLSGIAYGSKAGMIVGAVGAVINYIGYKRVSFFAVIVIPTYMIIGYSASYLQFMPIAQLGLFYVILYNVVITPLIMVYMNAKLSKCLWFAVTNVIFNYFLFAKIAPVLLSLMV